MGPREPLRTQGSRWEPGRESRCIDWNGRDDGRTRQAVDSGGILSGEDCAGLVGGLWWLVLVVGFGGFGELGW